MYCMQTIIGNDIGKAAQLLSQNEVVAIPTETVYGLAGNALHEKVIKRIFQIKKRPATVPLMLQLPAFEKVFDYVENVPEIFFQLADRFSPGPLTYVMQKSKLIPDIATAGLGTIAIRIPDHPVTLKLLEKLDFPIFVPSANMYGEKSPDTAKKVYKNFNGKIPFILDGGKCKYGKASTIITIDNNKVIILRQGSITEKEISEALKT